MSSTTLSESPPASICLINSRLTANNPIVLSLPASISVPKHWSRHVSAAPRSFLLPPRCLLRRIGCAHNPICGGFYSDWMVSRLSSDPFRATDVLLKLAVLADDLATGANRATATQQGLVADEHESRRFGGQSCQLLLAAAHHGQLRRLFAELSVRLAALIAHTKRRPGTALNDDRDGPPKHRDTPQRIPPRTARTFARPCAVRV